MSVYKSINKVQEALAKSGISKANRNAQQGYNFRGIDDVFNALSPLLAEHGLCILPRCTERVCNERINSKGTALFYVTVRCEFDFVCAEDGSTHTIATYGEAMDSGDKATNKAMSAAYKYAAIQAFAIPTEGDNDADAQTHEVAPSKPAAKPDPASIAAKAAAGVKAGKAAEVAGKLAAMPEAARNAVWALLSEEDQSTLGAVWPAQ